MERTNLAAGHRGRTRRGDELDCLLGERRQKAHALDACSRSRDHDARPHQLDCSSSCSLTTWCAAPSQWDWEGCSTLHLHSSLDSVPCADAYRDPSIARCPDSLALNYCTGNNMAPHRAFWRPIPLSGIVPLEVQIQKYVAKRFHVMSSWLRIHDSGIALPYLILSDTSPRLTKSIGYM